MQCVGIDQFGQVVAETGSVCTYVLIKSDDFLASASLTSEDIALSFGFGFGTVVSLWFLSYCVKAATKTVKLL